IAGRIQHGHLVSQALRRHAKHPAQLAAAEQTEPFTRRNRGSQVARGPRHVVGGKRIARAASVCFARNAASFFATMGSLAAIIAAANSPAFAAPASPIANVATGMPFGIWTIE